MWTLSLSPTGQCARFLDYTEKQNKKIKAKFPKRVAVFNLFPRDSVLSPFPKINCNPLKKESHHLNKKQSCLLGVMLSTCGPTYGREAGESFETNLGKISRPYLKTKTAIPKKGAIINFTMRNRYFLSLGFLCVCALCR